MVNGTSARGAGMVALREIDRRLGIAHRLADYIGDPRLAERVRHSVADIVRFRMMMQTRTQRRDVIALDADSDEGAWAFRDNGARNSDMMSPRADASLAVEFVTLRQRRRQSFEAVFAERLRRRGVAGEINAMGVVDEAAEDGDTLHLLKIVARINELKNQGGRQPARSAPRSTWC